MSEENLPEEAVQRLHVKLCSTVSDNQEFYTKATVKYLKIEKGEERGHSDRTAVWVLASHTASLEFNPWYPIGQECDP